MGLSLPEQCSFIGRQTELAELEEWVGFPSNNTVQKSIVTLWGLAGVGKSQLVSEFVKRQREKSPCYDIFWLVGTSKEAFEQSILSVLQVSNITGSTTSESDSSYTEHRSQLVSAFFLELRNTARTRWLLVVDGIPNDSSVQHYIRGYLEKLPSGSIILTTTSIEVVKWYYRSMEIKGLSEVDAVKLLRREVGERAKSADNGKHLFLLQRTLSSSYMADLTNFLDILDLAAMLNFHPLSLRLAGSVISQFYVSVRHYIDEWETRQLDYEHTANTTLAQSLELSFEELERTNQAAAKLLLLFGYLDHRDLWADLCQNASDDRFPDWLREIALTKHFQRYYATMRNLSFIEIKPHSGEKDCVHEIHPAVHEFARSKAKDSEEEYVRAAISLVAAMVPRSSDKDFLETVRRLEPHADQCRIYMEQGRAGSSMDLLELEQFGNLFRHVGRYDEASRLYERVLEFLIAEDSPDQLTFEMMARIENNLGLVHHARRRYDFALLAYDRSLKRQLNIVPKDDDALMSTQYNQGRTLLMVGKLDEALQMLLTAAAHFSRFIPQTGSGNRATEQLYFRILNDVGEIYLRKGHVKQAEQNFRAAFHGHSEVLHKMHPATFAVRLNIGRVCVELSRFSAANKIFECIIATYTEWWGRRHSETMRAVAELAESHLRHAKLKRIMASGGDWELIMASDLWTEILSFHQEAFGPNSDVATFAKSKLQQLRLLCSAAPEDPYSEFYSL